MAILKYLHPSDFFSEVKNSCKNLMAFDLGEKSIGICIGNGNIFYPIMGRDWDGYVLSPLEQILNKNSDGSGKYDDDGWFIPNNLFSPQVLNPSTMAVSEMREVLNQLAKKYDVEYYIFGFNAYEKIRNGKQKFAFIRKQLKDLEDDGGLTEKWFTFVDESFSTISANDFLYKKFPELYNPQLFFTKYNLVHGDHHYPGPCDQNFTDDLTKVHKRILDSYSAYCFTWEFFFGNTLMTKEGKVTTKGKAKVQMMVDYAKFIGYPPQRKPTDHSKHDFKSQ